MKKIRTISLTFISLIIISTISTTFLTVGNSLENDKITNIVVFSKRSDTEMIKRLRIDGVRMNILDIITPDNEQSYESIQSFENLINQAEVFFVDRFLPTQLDYLELLVSYVNGTLDNCGMVLFGLIEGDINESQIEIINPILPVNIINYRNSSIYTDNFYYEVNIIQNYSISEESKILVKDIYWNSIPSIDRRTVVKVKENANQIIQTVPKLPSDPVYSIVAEWNMSNDAGKVIFYSFEIIEKNIAVPLWPYFNYLLYLSASYTNPDINNIEILNYNRWPHSPIPHQSEIIGWFIWVGILYAVTFISFILVKKHSKSWRELEEEDNKRYELQKKNLKLNGGEKL